MSERGCIFYSASGRCTENQGDTKFQESSGAQGGVNRDDTSHYRQNYYYRRKW